MGLGGCILMIAAGAILTFATDWHLKNVNLPLVGLILMAVGTIGLAAYVSIAYRRRAVIAPVSRTVVEREDERRRGS